MPFRFTLDGDSWLDEDLTLDEAIAMERELGESWQALNPFRSAAVCKAMLMAFLARTVGAEAAAARVGPMTLREAFDSFEPTDDDLPEEYENGIPLAAAGQATTTSSPASSGSGGPPT